MDWEQEHLASGKYTLDMVKIDRKVREVISHIKLAEAQKEQMQNRTTYIGKVNFDPMDDDAEENGDVIIDDMAPEDPEGDQERANHIAKSQARGEM